LITQNVYLISTSLKKIKRKVVQPEKKYRKIINLLKRELNIESLKNSERAV
jgi:hypothetical protein